MKHVINHLNFLPNFMTNIFYKGNQNKAKSALSPWITNGIAKTSKRKQKLYEKVPHTYQRRKL